MYVRILRQRFILFVALLIIVCIVINYIPIHNRLLPGYETLRQTDQGTRYLKYSDVIAILVVALSAFNVAHSVQERLGNKTPINGYGFPASGDFCGGTKQWQEYADFHHSVVTGKENGRYLKYACNKLRCGGFGNRIEGIAMGLVMSMLTGRVFLLEFYHPFDFSKFLLPNLINWKVKVPPDREVKYFDLMNKEHVRKEWKDIETLLLSPDMEDTVIEFATNVGIDMFMNSFSDTMKRKFLNMKINSFHNHTALYGCVMRFLFRHSPVITDSVLREQKSLELRTGHYVAVHIRTGMGENVVSLNLPSGKYWKPYLECAIATAKAYASQYCFSRTCPVYVLADVEEVKKYAISYYGDYIKTSTVYVQHIDKPKVEIPQLVEDTFIGLITDIEVAARAAIFISTEHSTFSDLIEGLGFYTSRTSFTVKQCAMHH